MSEESYRLSQHIVPIAYNIRIIPTEPDYNKFIGRCIIGFNIYDSKTTECSGPSGKSNYIIMNGIGLTVLHVNLYGMDSSIHHTHISTIYDNTIAIQQIKFEFDSIPNKYGVIVIEYTGLISEELSGFYKCKQNDEFVMLTVFEPVSARSCFPCFDEPHFKATFKLEIMAPSDKTVLSNTDIESIIHHGKDNLYIFKQTPIMSTYLVAFYIGHVEYTESFTRDLVRIRIYSSKRNSYSKLALDTAVKCMDYMTEYFGVKYPLEKLDLIAVPVFATSAMENWGLITFRESSLLCDPDNHQIDIIYTICHELAHQWFGNLVTMNWWSELWLNESFATWLGWLVVDHMYPQWNINDKFYYDNYIDGLSADSLHNSHSVSVNITNLSNIGEIFDTITYKKGASIIKMLISYIGENEFQDGIRLYMKKYAYMATTTDDLWQCLEFASTKHISEFMHMWIYTKNYPLVTVMPYGKLHLRISQSIFSFDNLESNNLWTIPLTQNILLEQKEIIILRTDLHNKINSIQSGFYRIFYHEDILKHIIQKKSDGLSNMNIMAMLSDLYFLLKANKITYDYYLNYTNKLIQISPQSELICNINLGNYINFKTIIKNKKLITMYANILLTYVNRYDFDIYPNDDPFKISLLNLGTELKINSYVNYCINIFDDFADNSHIIDIIFRVGIFRSNKFDFLMELLYTDNKFEFNVVNCLGLVNDELRYRQVLNLFKTDKISIQNKLHIFKIAGLNSKLNYLLWEYIRDNWDLIYVTFVNYQSGLVKVISSMNYLIGTDKLVTEIKSFFEFKDKHNMEFAYNKMIEIIQLNYKCNIQLNKECTRVAPRDLPLD